MSVHDTAYWKGLYPMTSTMIKKLVLAFVGLGAAGGVAIYLLTIPLLHRLPKPGRVSMDGITTPMDAVEACRRTHVQGWEQVAYARTSRCQKIHLFPSQYVGYTFQGL